MQKTKNKKQKNKKTKKQKKQKTKNKKQKKIQKKDDGQPIDCRILGKILDDVQNESPNPHGQVCPYYTRLSIYPLYGLLYHQKGYFWCSFVCVGKLSACLLIKNLIIHLIKIS